MFQFIDDILMGNERECPQGQFFTNYLGRRESAISKCGVIQILNLQRGIDNDDKI
jgi:hypothetical protein